MRPHERDARNGEPRSGPAPRAWLTLYHDDRTGIVTPALKVVVPLTRLDWHDVGELLNKLDHDGAPTGEGG